ESDISITPLNHISCTEWNIDDSCMLCLCVEYQRAAEAALKSGTLLKSNTADYAILAGVFVPFSPTKLMKEVFTGATIKAVRSSLTIDTPNVIMEDAEVQAAIRGYATGDLDGASASLDKIKNRRMKQLFTTLLNDLPLRPIEVSEETLVTNYVSPVMRAFSHYPPEDTFAHFPNTASSTQIALNMKADRADYKVTKDGTEIVFGEVTGMAHRSEKSKNGWDMWRLLRFGKAALEAGADSVPLVQVIYDLGTVWKMCIPVRGLYVAIEVGPFVLPTHLYMIGAFQASLAPLLWLQKEILKPEETTRRRRSWGTSDKKIVKSNLK
ncbi:hypothetical protein BGW38_006514, partial [Lunasporangiospora selenospora]